MSRVSRTLLRLGRRRWFAVVGRRFVPIDRWLFRHLGSRWTAADRFGLPAFLLLTTTGRKSGQPRTQPLIYTADGDGWVVIGSNWGQAHHPAWTGNLLANPDASITIASGTVEVRGELATGTEYERLWKLLLAIWPAYQTYVERAGGRPLRIFRLTRRVSPD